MDDKMKPVKEVQNRMLELFEGGGAGE